LALISGCDTVRGGRRSNHIPAITKHSTAKLTTPRVENPTSVRVGSAAALKTAQPVTGATPTASTRGNRWRAMA
jgi:hypothetical protein